MASIRDMAKKAGVGVGAVSRVLNGTGYVAEDTKARVLAIAEKLNYQPNELARNLSRNRTGIVGIAIPDMEDPFFSKLLKHMEIRLYKNGCKAMICNTVEMSNCEQDFVDMLRQNVMDGITTGAHSLQDYTYLNLSKPVVATDRNLGPGIPIIHSNHKAGGRVATRLLLDADCKDVLDFGGFFRVHMLSSDKHQEFKQVMEENRASVRTVEVAWNMMRYGRYCRIMEQYMDTYRDIDGVFTTGIKTLYCPNIANQRGVKAPEKLHIVGYDTVDMTRLFTPKLTSIAQDIPGLATACVDTMMDLLDGKEVEMEQILPVSMQKGGTV